LFTSTLSSQGSTKCGVDLVGSANVNIDKNKGTTLEDATPNDFILKLDNDVSD